MMSIEEKIPVFAEDIDDGDSNDYLLYKVTRVPKKVQMNCII